MTRVAVVFSGQIRSFKSCYPSIYKYVISQYEPKVDIFMHLWEYGNDISEYKEKNKFITQFKLQNDECSKEYVIEKAQPTKIVCDKWSKGWEQKIMNDLGGYDIIKNMNEKEKNYAVSCMCMYYKIMLANKLKIDYEVDYGFKYDLVIRVRLDFKWNEQINFNLQDIQDLLDSQIVIINDNYAKHNCNDKFFMTTSSTMDDFCNIPFFIYDIWKNKEVPLLEGQEVNKWMIKKLELQVIKIGSNNTYEKYLGSKRITYKDKTYLLNNCTSQLGFLMCEHFLNMGIRIHGIIDNIDNMTFEEEKKLNILYKYELFSPFYKEQEDYNIYSRVICIDNINHLKNHVLSRRISVFIGNELPENITLNQLKQHIIIKNINKISDLCLKIYQKQSTGNLIF